MRAGLWVLLAVTVTTAAEATVVEMKRDASIEKNIIRLGDIARVHDAPPGERETLEGVYVTLSPAPGQARTVEVREVRDRLKALGMDLGAVIFAGPTATQVARRQAAGRPADPAAPDSAAGQAPKAALDLLARFAAAALGRSADDLEVTLDATSARRVNRLAATGLRLAVVAEAAPVKLGANALLVIAYAGAVERERHTLTVEVKAYASVPVAARDIARQRRIVPGDLRLERRLVADQAQAALKVEDLVDRLAGRSIREGTMIEPSMVVDFPLVRRGDMVTVIARARHLEVKMAGQALEDGAAGRIVKVRNLSTNKVFPATVEAARTVALSVAEEERP